MLTGGVQGIIDDLACSVKLVVREICRGVTLSGVASISSQECNTGLLCVPLK